MNLGQIPKLRETGNFTSSHPQALGTSPNFTLVRLPTRNFDLNEDVSVKLSLPERFFVMMEEPTSSFAGVLVSSLAWNCSIG